VHQDDDGQPAGALCDAKFARDGDLFAVAVAAQELLVRDRERGNGVNLDPRRRVLADLLRVGRGAEQAGADNRTRNGQAPVGQHGFLACVFPPKAALFA